MEKHIKLIKRVSMIVTILIIVLSIIVFLIKIKNDKGTSEPGEPTKFEQQDTYVPEEKIEKVKNRNKYYTVKMLVERYMTYCNDLNNENLETDLRSLTITALDSILGESYKEEFSINKNSIAEVYENLEQDEVIEISDIYIVEKDASSNIFLVYGTKKIAQEDFQLMIRTNSRQMIFSVYPEEYMKKYNYSYNNKKEDFDEIFLEELEENEYNKFKYLSISEEKMAVEYFNDLKNKILSNTAETYEILDEEYKNKRFESQEEFNQYVQNNKKDLAKIEINGYQVDNFNDYKIYTCKDQYGNIYTFRETAIKEYTVKLDRYTIKDEEFINIYKKASNQEKVAINIDLWIQMINNRDYKSAYNVLDESFRDNYFKSVDKFEAYMKQYFPAHYKIEFGEFAEEAGVYTQLVTFINMENDKDVQLERTFIIQLKENNEFVMSMNLFRH